MVPPTIISQRELVTIVPRLTDCVLALKALLLCGDIKQNPDPNCEVLGAINNLTTHFGEHHDSLQKTINEVKENPLPLDSKMTDLTTLLTVLEQKVNCLESFLDDQHAQDLLAAAVRNESAALTLRVDDFDDRSRRYNLIFNGLSDYA